MLLHGYGANDHALLAQVSPHLDSDVVLASLQGPVTEGNGFAWMSLETSLTTLTAEAIAAVARDRAQAVVNWINGLPPFRSIGLLGVSVGAVLGLHLLRMAPAYSSYAVNLSGYVLAGEEAGDAALLHMQPPGVLGRGRSDTAIPSSYIERTQTWLSVHSTLSAHVYPVGHEETPRKFADAGALVTATVQVS